MTGDCTCGAQGMPAGAHESFCGQPERHDSIYSPQYNWKPGGEPATPLIEDHNGQPLPPAMQRGGAVWNAAREWLVGLTGHDVEEWPSRTTDDLMVKLAPALED